MMTENYTLSDLASSIGSEAAQASRTILIFNNGRPMAPFNFTHNATYDTPKSNFENDPSAGPFHYTEIHWAYRVATVIITYILPLIILTGLVGNTTSIVVFLSKDLRRLSSSVYVLAVLTSDTGLLIGLLFVWLEVLGIRLNHMDGLCQFLVFLTYACSFLSVWYTVCITAENYIAICHPTKVKVLCTRRRATAIVTLLAVMSLPLYILSAAATEVRVNERTGQPLCQRNQQEFRQAMHVLTIFDSVITLLLPLVFITIMLVAIALSIVHTYRWRRSSPGSQKRREELMQIPQVRVAKMLFALSLSYIVMNSPSHVTRLYHLLVSSNGGLATEEPGVEGAVTADNDDLFLTDGSGSAEDAMLARSGDYIAAEAGDTVVSEEASLVQLVLLYGSYSYYAVKFILFLSFSKNFRRSFRDTCGASGEGCSSCSPCLKRQTGPTDV